VGEASMPKGFALGTGLLRKSRHHSTFNLHSVGEASRPKSFALGTSYGNHKRPPPKSPTPTLVGAHSVGEASMPKGFALRTGLPRNRGRNRGRNREHPPAVIQPSTFLLQPSKAPHQDLDQLHLHPAQELDSLNPRHTHSIYRNQNFIGFPPPRVVCLLHAGYTLCRSSATFVRRKAWHGATEILWPHYVRTPRTLTWAVALPPATTTAVISWQAEEHPRRYSKLQELTDKRFIRVPHSARTDTARGCDGICRRHVVQSANGEPQAPGR
jgi:hypothetical protein